LNTGTQGSASGWQRNVWPCSWSASLNSSSLWTLKRDSYNAVMHLHFKVSWHYVMYTIESIILKPYGAMSYDVGKTMKFHFDPFNSTGNSRISNISFLFPSFLYP
jgi:hypothetical protein